MNSKLRALTHITDVCVIGGGIGGMFAAISAARNGAKVVLMHDRPVLGGNASSEVRMWISGAGTRVRDLQETDPRRTPPGEYAPQSETELQHLGQYPL